MLTIRRAAPADSDALWAIIEPVIRAGETYPYPRDMSREAALAYWLGQDGRSEGMRAYIAEERGEAVGTYYLRPNQPGLGAHVCNCGYMVAEAAQGRGVARMLCADSLEEAREAGFRAMQYNLVVSTNERAIRLWTGMGFETVGALKGAFAHPTLGEVDAYVMYRRLED